MTENCACITRGWPKDPGAGGSVGGPHVNCEIKLIDVTEMGYSSEDKPNPRGEICVRGDMSFVGYYKGTWLQIIKYTCRLTQPFHRPREYEEDDRFGGVDTYR